VIDLADETRPPFRPDIEGLRGVAILLVVAYHAGVPGIGGGYVGVDVFFVLSGYLITWLLLCESDATGRIDLVRFYARRARRLLPAVAAMLAVTVAAAFIVYSPAEQRVLARSALATAAYVSNLWFAHNVTDYFGAQVAEDPLLHTWSLAVEEQFYLAWPALMLLALRWKRWRLVIVAALALASLAWCVWLTRKAQPLAFFLSPTRGWEFCVGALALLVRPAVKLAWVGALGLAAILAAALAFDRTTAYPGFAALVPVLGTACVLRAPPRLLSNRALLHVGRVSYSLYLWHWPVLVIAAAIVPLSAALRSVCVAAALVLAELSYRYVEHPVRVNAALVRKPRLALSMALTVTLASLATAQLWRHVASLEALSGPQARIAAAKADTPGIDRCFADFFGTDVVECTFAAADSGVTVVLFGDSHVAQWFPALEPIARAHGWKLVTLLKAACPPEDVQFIYPALQRRYVECETWRANALARVQSLKPHLVIESSSQWYPMSSAVSLDAWQHGLRRTMEALRTSGHVVHIADTPRPDFDVPDCLARAQWRRRWDATTCAFPQDKALDAEVRRVEREATRDLAHVTFVDLNAQICPGEQCAAQRGDIIVYQDSNHLTATFVRSLVPALERALAKDARAG
jgi:peptidoglycan/LPS O-acetylase OafA/YrhL